MITLGTSKDLSTWASTFPIRMISFNQRTAVLFHPSSDFFISLQVVDSWEQLLAMGGAYVCSADDPTSGYVLGGSSLLNAFSAQHLGKRLVYEPNVQVRSKGEVLASTHNSYRSKRYSLHMGHSVSTLPPTSPVRVFGVPSRAEDSVGWIGIQNKNHPLLARGYGEHAVPFRNSRTTGASHALNGFNVLTSTTKLVSRQLQSSVMARVCADFREEMPGDYRQALEAAIKVTNRAFQEESGKPVTLPIVCSSSTYGHYFGPGPDDKMTTTNSTHLVLDPTKQGLYFSVNSAVRQSVEIGRSIRMAFENASYDTSSQMGEVINGAFKTFMPHSLSGPNSLESTSETVGFIDLSSGVVKTGATAAPGIIVTASQVNPWPVLTGTYTVTATDNGPTHMDVAWVPRSSLPRDVDGFLWWNAWPLLQHCVTFDGTGRRHVEAPSGVGLSTYQLAQRHSSGARAPPDVLPS